MTSVDVGHELHHDQLAQEAGMQALMDLYEAGEEGDCVCETCIVREILTAAYEHLEILARENMAYDALQRRQALVSSTTTTDVVVRQDQSARSIRECAAEGCQTKYIVAAGSPVDPHRVCAGCQIKDDYRP
jgi:hypothetical protein